MTDQQAPAPHGPPPGERAYWLDSKANVDKLLYGFYAVCAVLFALDLVIHRHEQFDIAHLFGFHSFYGFIGCAALIIASKGLRVLVMRSEDYYDR